jgi:tRNA1Val (adenine37-N6)-methyltransferase
VWYQERLVTSTTRGAPPTSLFGGALTIHQPARGEGYRVNVDAVLLAWFAGQERRARAAVDLGAGVGAVGLSLLHRDRAERVVFVEKDRALSDLSRENLSANGWGARGEVRCADVASSGAVVTGAADLVVCNPPYVAPGRGREPLVSKEARVGSLDHFVRAARLALGPRGRACFVYPAAELVTLTGALRDAGLEPKRLCFVHASEERPARVALVLAMPGKRGGLVVSPPLVERTGDRPSAELEAILR